MNNPNLNNLCGGSNFSHVYIDVHKILVQIQKWKKCLNKFVWTIWLEMKKCLNKLVWTIWLKMQKCLNKLAWKIWCFFSMIISHMWWPTFQVRNFKPSKYQKKNQMTQKNSPFLGKFLRLNYIQSFHFLLYN